jgi:hypothetical protein
MHIGRKKSVMERAHDYVESVADTVIPQLEAALESARDAAGPALADARDKAAPLVSDARDRAVPLLQDTRERAVTLTHDARDRAVPLLQDARDRAVPVLAEGKALAAEKAAVAATIAADKAAEGRDLAAAKVAELRHEPEPQRSKIKTVLVIGGLLAVGAAVFSKLRQSQKTKDNWQSSYTPAPPASPSGSGVSSPLPKSGTAGDPLTDPIKTPLDADTPTAVDAAEASDAMTDPTHRAPVDDAAGGAPGEALSDAVEEPHDVTTPDNPAEVIDVDEIPDNKHT